MKKIKKNGDVIRHVAFVIIMLIISIVGEKIKSKNSTVNIQSYKTSETSIEFNEEEDKSMDVKGAKNNSTYVDQADSISINSEKKVRRSLSMKGDKKDLFTLINGYKVKRDKDIPDLQKEFNSVIRQMVKENKKNTPIHQKLINCGMWSIFSLFFSLFILIIIGGFTPLVIFGLFMNNAENIVFLWIITIVCIFAAIFTKREDTWVRLAIITLSISTGIFTTEMYSDALESEPLKTPDKIALSLAISATLIAIFQTIYNGWLMKYFSR